MPVLKMYTLRKHFHYWLIFSWIFFLSSINGYTQNYYPIFSSVSPDGQGFEEFGHAVALEGDHALVGSWQENTDSNGLNPMLMAGAAYFFYNDPAEGWQISQKVVAPDREANDFYGSSVALAGEVAVIGAASKDDPIKNQKSSGVAYVYVRINGTWKIHQTLRASDSEDEALFGYSVSIQGEYIIIGAPYEDKDESGSDAMPDAGAIYVYHRDNSGYFSEVQKITASNRQASALFGSSISLFNTHMAVGAPNKSALSKDNNIIDGVGRVYTYLFDTDSIWKENQQIEPGEAHNHQSFGKSLCLRNGVLLIGIPGDGYDEKDKEYIEGAGSAVIWYYSASNTWKLQDKVVASDRMEMDAFGYSVALDQNQAIIGARNKATMDAENQALNESGTVYVFQKTGQWTQIRKIIARDHYMSDHFGHAVAAFGETFLVGAPNKTEPSKIVNGERGKVYFYEPCGDIEGTVDVFICEGDSMFLQGAWRTLEGTYLDTFILPFGFDSLAITNLFINTHFSSNMNTSICEGDSIWLENDYQTSPGTYVDSLLTIYGCDSVIVTTLTVLPSYQQTRFISICEGDSLYIDGEYRYTAGTYYDRFQSVYGCDSIFEIQLHILPVYEINRNASICEGDSIWLANGYRKAPGFYYDTLSSNFGCDSIIITSLTVFDQPQVHLGNDTTICEGENLTLDAGSGYVDYNWNDGMSVSQTITVQTAGTYYVAVTNNNGCQANDTIRVSLESCTTSILDTESLPDVLVYPNPVSNLLNVELGSSYFGNTLTYTIYNLSGRELQIKKQDLSSRVQFDLSDYSPGVYFLRMSNGQEQRTIKLIRK